MYGLVNKAIEDYVCSNFDADTWERIKEKAQVDVDVFVCMEAYPDEVTYSLVGAASELLGTPASEILSSFGEHWVGFTRREGYAELLAATGRTLPEFLSNLDGLHARVGLTYGFANTPLFRVKPTGPGELVLDYVSTRPGLGPMVMGLLQGLGLMFHTSVTVEWVTHRADGAACDQFLVKYVAPV
jgi:hypothetical protein